MPESEIGRTEAYEYINIYVPGLLETDNSIKGLLASRNTSFSILFNSRNDVELRLKINDLKPNKVIPLADWMGLRLLRKKGGKYWRVETNIALSQRNTGEVGLEINYEGPFGYRAMHAFINIPQHLRTMHLNLNRWKFDISNQYLNFRIPVANGLLENLTPDEDAILQEKQKGGVVFYGIERGSDTFGVN